MEDKVRKFGVQLILHCLILAGAVFLSAISLSFWVGNYNEIGFSPSLLLKYLLIWIKWVFSDLSIKSFTIQDFYKSKSLLIILLPYFVIGSLYLKYRQKILSIDFNSKKESIYGDARWGTQDDIKRAGLRSKEGMLLGVDDYGYYINEGFQHSLLFAPTGSGKGVGFVIPNCLFWRHSIVVHDIKLENYEFCSGWRASIGQKVYVWEPSNPDGVTHCYNPLDWVSSKPGKMVDDVQKIANLLMPEQDMWNNEARSLFLGVVLYLIVDDNKVTSFGEVTRTMRNDDVSYNLAVVLDTMGDKIHPVGYMNLNAFLQKADKERSGVISTMNSSLELWANPLIDAATAKSDFSVMNFKKEATTLFVGLTPDNIQRLRKLMQVFYQQSTDFLSAKMPNLQEEPYGVMFLMDEFPTLGKMEQFKAGIAYFRGYRVRLFLVVQDTQQLKGTYEEAGMNSFLSNSTYRITYSANNYETANLISQLIGNKTVESESFSRKSIDFGVNKAVNISQASRALLLPQEVMQLPRDEQIVLIESFPPIRSKKIFYFKDKFFTDRLLPATFVPTQEAYSVSEINEEKED